MCLIKYECVKGREKQSGAARFKEAQLERILFHEHDQGGHRFFTRRRFIHNNTLAIWIWKKQVSVWECQDRPRSDVARFFK